MTASRLTHAIRDPKGAIALMPYLTAGYPDRATFIDLLRSVAEVADAIELGVPFTDPMADGTTIQETSRKALESGVTLPWILSTLKEAEIDTPCVLMSYTNPLLAYGFEALVADASEAGVCGFIVPDLPLEECGPFDALCQTKNLAIVQLVSPVTSPERMKRVCAASRGFVYAVTVTGVTGTAADPTELARYLARLKETTDLPVCAGFGIRERPDVQRLEGVADGAIVGPALLQVLADGGDPVSYLRSLRG